jgi:hypothetical protein
LKVHCFSKIYHVIEICCLSYEPNKILLRLYCNVFPDLKCCQYLTVPARSANYSRKHQYFEFPGNVCSGLYPFRKRSSKGKDQEKKDKELGGLGGRG